MKLSELYQLYKNNKKQIVQLKIMVLVIINMWLIFIFWKIIALDGLDGLNGLKITNNNVAITKMETIIGPILQILGIDVLSPNTIKMIIITTIIVISNLAVLYFSEMMAFIILGITARYSYKAYNNYINKDTLNYYGFEKVALELTDQEKATILNEFIKENGIKDEHAIGYLQNVINKVSCINKNELTLSIQNNWLDYKQHILSKIILHQKEQMDNIEIINKKAWTWEAIDYGTWIKIGGGIIIVAVIVIGGYYYYSNNAIEINAENIKKVQEEIVLLKNMQQNQQKHFLEYQENIDSNILNINENVSKVGENIINNIKDLVNTNIETQSINELELNRLDKNIQNINDHIQQVYSDKATILEVCGLITQEIGSLSNTINITYDTLKALLVTLNIKNIDEIIIPNPTDPNANDRLLSMVKEFSKKIK